MTKTTKTRKTYIEPSYECTVAYNIALHEEWAARDLYLKAQYADTEDERIALVAEADAILENSAAAYEVIWNRRFDTTHPNYQKWGPRLNWFIS